MIRKSAFVTSAVICAVVFTGTTPTQAADQSAIKRAIVVTVLNNLGVQPTDQLVNEIVGDIPIEFFDSTLVREVGTALDNSEDPTLIISQTVDSDGDGIPNADATVDSVDETDDETTDDSGDETVVETDDNGDGETDGEGDGETDDEGDDDGDRDN
jgi:Ca2+-binding EF-hand superfamily protein